MYFTIFENRNKLKKMAINQIYHVAKCGSTLLSHILASQNVVYNEPSWGISPDSINEISNQSTDNIIVKFWSGNSCSELDLTGNKVFLYRPLSQHLCKLKNLNDSWLEVRGQLFENVLQEKNIKSIIDYIPKTDLERSALVWVLYVLTMKKKSNVLWIKTNDFLNDKIETTKKVCQHFQIPEIQNFEIINYDVKLVRNKLIRESAHELLNDSPINLSLFYQLDKANYSSSEDDGIVLTETALSDSEVAGIVNIVKTYLPDLEEYFY